MAVKTRTEGKVLIVEFEDSKMLDEAVINEVGNELMELVDQCEGKQMLLDFSEISFMSSSMIGKIIFLSKDCKAKGVDLRLCGINSNVMEVFSLMNLDKVLSIYPTYEQAKESFG